MIHWALLSYNFLSYYPIVSLSAISDVPCHLFAHHTTTPPTRTLQSIIRRGVTLFCYPAWHFDTQAITEQSQFGDSLDHSFTWAPWHGCMTRYTLLSTTTDLALKVSSSPIITYHLPVFSPPLIQDIWVNWRVNQTSSFSRCSYSLKSNDVIYDGPIVGFFGYGWTWLLSKLGPTNPCTGQPWTFEDLSQLQVGVRLAYTMCDQIYLEILSAPYKRLYPSSNGDQISVNSVIPPTYQHHQAVRYVNDGSFIHHTLVELSRDLFHYGL